MRKSVLVVLMLILLIAMIITGLRYTGRTVNQENVIKIGWIGPLSGYGASWGIEQQRVLDIEVDKINNNGRVNGKKIEIIYEDGKCDGKEATIAAERLINVDKINILMTICSTETLAVIPISEKNKVLQISVWSTNPKITNSGDYIFRVSYSDADIAKAMSGFISKKYKKIGIITELNDYSVGLSSYFKKYYKGEVFEETYTSYSRDFKTEITKILEKNPDAVFINPNDPSAGIEILNELRELGYKGQLFGNFFAESNEVLKNNNSNGMIFFSDPSVEESLIKQELFNEYISKYGKKPNFEFGVSAQYDSIYILKKAIESVGENPAQIKDYLHNMNNFTGALGTYRFDKNGDATGFKPSLKIIKEGKIASLN